MALVPIETGLRIGLIAIVAITTMVQLWSYASTEEKT